MSLTEQAGEGSGAAASADDDLRCKNAGRRTGERRGTALERGDPQARGGLGRAAGRLRPQEVAHLATLLPAPPAHHPHYGFRFVDLFAGIGGIRSGFEAIGGQCVFTSEWNKHAVRKPIRPTGIAIRSNTVSMKISAISPSAIAPTLAMTRRRSISARLSRSMMCCSAGFFPASLSHSPAYRKKNAMGRAHGFACETQGTLFLMW